MTYAIYTLGCKVNMYESEYISRLFRGKEYKEVLFSDIADIYIINTCTVTNNSDSKSRKIIRQAIRRNEDAIIVVIGCYVQIKPEELKKIDGIDILVGTKNKSKVLDLVEEYIENKKNIDMIEKTSNEFEDMYIKEFSHKTRAFVKIQDGCDNFCSYCIIPYARGPLKSKELNKVVEEVKELVKNNHKEVVLTGIHTGNYGKDINIKLTDLLKELVKIEDLKRLRISSIEPVEITDEFLDLLKDNKVLVDHMHIPIQSGNNKILKLMNRRYDVETFIKIITKLRKVRPAISITTDVIVGFPNETEEDFKNTYENIKKIKFAKLHVFPYSKRDGTKAATMDNQVDDKIKKDRVNQLLELSLQLEREYIKKFIGKQLDVLVEKNNIGHAGNYINVKINEKVKNGNLVRVTIKKEEYPYTIGQLDTDIDTI